MLLTITFRIPQKTVLEFVRDGDGLSARVRLEERIREVVAGAGLILPSPTGGREREEQHDGDQG